MEFVISDAQVRREKRKQMTMVLMFAVFLAVLAAKAINAEKMADLFFPVLGFVILSPLIVTLSKRVREGKAAFPRLQLDEAERTIDVLHQDLRVTVELAQVQSVRLQYTSSRLVSILLKTTAGGDMRFEGYENIDELASALQRILPQERVKRISFFHR